MCLALLASPGWAEEGPTRVELETRVGVAKEWVKLGKWCVRNRLGTEAREVATLARQVAPEGLAVRGLSDLLEDAAGCSDEASERSRGKFAGKRRASAEAVARLYERLAKVARRHDDAAVRSRLRGYLVDALASAPTPKRWERVLEAIAIEREAGATAAALALAERAQALDPPESAALALAEALDLAAIDNVVLRSSSAHSMRYYFSLPSGYQREARRWPVLVCVDGAGSGFEGMARGYTKARGDLPYLVVSPCSFSNTNQLQGKLLERYRGWYPEDVIEEAQRDRFGWDEAGLLAILAELRQRYRTEDRIYVTGFSGGGNLTYAMIFKHPDLIQAAAPACANFSRPGYRSLQGDFPTNELTFPIHLITGAEDPHREFTRGNQNSPGIEPQTDMAETLLRELGYPSVKRTLVPGLKHSPARDRVLEVFRPYLTGAKARGDPLD